MNDKDFTSVNKESIDIFGFIFLIILVSVFFLFPVDVVGFGVRLDDLVVLICIPFLIIIKGYVNKNFYNIIIFIFLISTFFSSIYGYCLLNVRFSFGDVNEFIRYIKILLFSVLLGYVSTGKLKSISTKVFYYGSFYIVFVGYFQYFDFFSIGNLFSHLYTNDSQIYRAVEHAVRRITVTGGGPNDGAIIVGYLIIFNFFCLFFTNNKKYLFLLLLLFPVLLFTQSRTTLVGVVFSILCVIFIIKGNLLKKVIIVLFLTVLGFFLIPLFKYILIGFKEFFENEDPSALARLENIKIAYNMFLKSPVFGYGFSKSLTSGFHMDSEYLSLISRFGLVGTVFSLLLVIYPVFLIKKVYRVNNVQVNILYYTCLSSSIMGAVVMLTNDFITGYQSFLPYILLAVLSKRMLDDGGQIKCMC